MPDVYVDVADSTEGFTYPPEQVENARRVAMESAKAVMRETGDEKKAVQTYQDAYYELLPRYSPWYGPFRGRLISDKSSGSEFLRTMKRIHLYHGSYIPGPESREEMLARLGTRHIHARGCGCGMSRGYKTRKRDGRKFRA